MEAGSRYVFLGRQHGGWFQVCVFRPATWRLVPGMFVFRPATWRLVPVMFVFRPATWRLVPGMFFLGQQH